MSSIRRVLIVLLFCTSCALAVAPAETPPAAPRDERAGESRPWDTVIIEPSPGHPIIRTRDKFNPIWWFKNADDPLPPQSYRPGDKHRLMKWRLRNPFHNFTFYVIGVADKEVMRSGRYPEKNFSPDGGWNLAVTRRGWVYLPFTSWCHGAHGFHFYCGWRSSGNFGFKCNVE